MDRTHASDVEVGVGAKNDAVLVCATNQGLRSELASLLRQNYPVRTADSESDAVASIDGNVTVLVVDVTDREFSLDRMLAECSECECRFQVAAIVGESPDQWVRDRCDGFVRKPVDHGELRSMVGWLHCRGRYDKTLGAYYALSDDYATLVADPDADRSELRSLEQQLVQVRSELDDVVDSLDDEDALQIALKDDGDSGR